MASISTTKAAERLSLIRGERVSERTIKKMCKEGSIPAERLNGNGPYMIDDAILESITINPRGWPKGRKRKVDRRTAM
jgi:hypothetical protein